MQLHKTSKLQVFLNMVDDPAEDLEVLVVSLLDDALNRNVHTKNDEGGAVLPPLSILLPPLLRPAAGCYYLLVVHQ